MKSRTWFALMALTLLLALGGSAVLYQRSRGANMDAHARVVAITGQLRHEQEALGELVLAARFGLLNQYDGLVRTSQALADTHRMLVKAVGEAVPSDPELTSTLSELGEAVVGMRDAVERFKADNSTLRNSVYYVPGAAARVRRGDRTESMSTAVANRSAAVDRLVEAALTYNLIGDANSKQRVRAASAELEAQLRAEDRSQALLLRHAELILTKQPAVDAWVRAVLNNDVAPGIDRVAERYRVCFNAIVAEAGTYRQLLYGWSVALAVALALIGLQLRRLYADLERRVKERTRELDRAVTELWGEMKLARKIQEALVPSAPTLAGCDVAAEMRAAEQVGGDYYDVVIDGDREWILIGDVSGHGVPAGLIMMMCQTAVRTALRCKPDLMPDELLADVNQVLTENISQLGENKYMTISALRRDPDGTLHVAGAHQDLFIYRAARNEVEVIPTEGMWLGLHRDIAALLNAKSFTLAESDVLLLYTDGITEAAKDGRLFDNAGLQRVLEGAKSKSAQQILSEIFDAVSGHEVSDDATALVIRQLRSDANREVA